MDAKERRPAFWSAWPPPACRSGTGGTNARPPGTAPRSRSRATTVESVAASAAPLPLPAAAVAASAADISGARSSGCCQGRGRRRDRGCGGDGGGLGASMPCLGARRRSLPGASGPALSPTALFASATTAAAAPLTLRAGSNGWPRHAVWSASVGLALVDGVVGAGYSQSIRRSIDQSAPSCAARGAPTKKGRWAKEGR